MNELSIFQFEGATIRTEEDNGIVWFVAADVCKYFGIRNPRNVTARLDKNDLTVMIVDTPGGKQRMTMVNESGLYRILFSLTPSNVRGIKAEEIRRRQEQARRFKRWVTHEVLPSIRKHGMYATPMTVDEIIADPEKAIRLLERLKKSGSKDIRLKTV